MTTMIKQFEVKSTEDRTVEETIIHHCYFYYYYYPTFRIRSGKRSVTTTTTMANILTRRLANPGNHFTKRIQSFAGSASFVVGFPFEYYLDCQQKQCSHSQQKHQFGSFSSGGHDDNSLTVVGCPISLSGSIMNKSLMTLLSSSSLMKREFSSNATNNNDDDDQLQQQQQQHQQGVLSPSNNVFTDSETGKTFGVILDTRKLPRLKPSVVKRRLDKCKTYIGREKGIRQSPWKLNRVCQLAAGLTLEEALTQLKFCDIKNSDLVAKVLKRTSNLSDIRDGLQISQLEVKECFTTKSLMLRRIKPMGRGRHGVMHHKFSHIRVVLREIDFPLRIYQQRSFNQKKKWMFHQQRAAQDAQAAKAKREETDRLVKQSEDQLQARKDAAAAS